MIELTWQTIAMLFGIASIAGFLDAMAGGVVAY